MFNSDLAGLRCCNNCSELNFMFKQASANLFTNLNLRAFFVNRGSEQNSAGKCSKNNLSLVFNA